MGSGFFGIAGLSVLQEVAPPPSLQSNTKKKRTKNEEKQGGKKKTNINRLNLQPFTTPPSKLLQMQKRPKVHNCFGGFQGKESVV